MVVSPYVSGFLRQMKRIEEDLGLTFKISLIIPTMVCDLPVPGGPCNMQIRGIGNAMCTAFVAMEMAFAWNSLYS